MPSSARTRRREEVPMLDDRKLSVLRAIVEDYVRTHEPVGSKGAGRPALAGRLAGHDPQRHGRPRGGGLHRPAAHQRRTGPDRQGLPAVRRPALPGQAAEPGRAPCDRELPGRGRRPRRRDGALGAPAGPDHPAGRPRPVPVADQLRGPPRRARLAQRAPPAAGPDRRHRPDRAARGRGARCPVRGRPRPAAHPAQRVGGRRVVHLGGRPRRRPPGSASTRPAVRPSRSCSRPCSRLSWSATRSGS